MVRVVGWGIVRMEIEQDTEGRLCVLPAGLPVLVLGERGWSAYGEWWYSMRVTEVRFCRGFFLK